MSLSSHGRGARPDGGWKTVLGRWRECAGRLPGTAQPACRLAIDLGI